MLQRAVFKAANITCMSSGQGCYTKFDFVENEEVDSVGSFFGVLPWGNIKDFSNTTPDDFNSHL